MWPYSWTHVGTPSHLGHMDRVAATMPSQAHAGAAQEAPNIGQREGQDVPLVRPSSCTVKGGIPSSRRYLPTYLDHCAPRRREDVPPLSSVGHPTSQDGHSVLAGIEARLLGQDHHRWARAINGPHAPFHPVQTFVARGPDDLVPGVGELAVDGGPHVSSVTARELGPFKDVPRHGIGEADGRNLHPGPS